MEIHNGVENPINILIVDDDQGLRDLLQRYLGEQGYQVSSVKDGIDMDRWLKEHHPDAIILDLMLPGEDGLSLARRLRTVHPQLPILMLSARGDEIDRIVGLEMGADDYLPKPFNPRELLARLKAILRRSSPPATLEREHTEENQYRFGPFILDLIQRSLSREGALISLTKAEFELLLALLKNPNQTLSRDQLVEMFMGYDRDPFDRSIDVRVTRLRRKIEPDPGNPRYIHTERGIGYRFTPDGGEG